MDLVLFHVWFGKKDPVDSSRSTLPGLLTNGHLLLPGTVFPVPGQLRVGVYIENNVE